MKNFTMENYTSEHTHRFRTEHAVVEYLMKGIAERIAHYRYLQSLLRRKNE